MKSFIKTKNTERPRQSPFRKNIYSLILTSILCFNFYFIQAQSKDSLIYITNRVYELTGFFCNVTFLVTDEGVILVDAGNYPEKGQRIQEMIAGVTDKPIKYIIITHYHGDHTNGLATLPTNVPIVAQKNTFKNLKNTEVETSRQISMMRLYADSLQQIKRNYTSDSPEFSKTDSIYKIAIKKLNELEGIKFIYPTLLVDTFQSMVLGKDTIELIYKGKGHTDGDLMVYFKTRKTMVMGDLLFTRCYPYIDPIGDVSNWSKILTAVADSDVEYYMPGHGEVTDRQSVILMSNYLTDLRTAVKKMKEEKKSLDEIKKTLKLPAYDSFGFVFLREQNMEAVYGQLK